MKQLIYTLLFNLLVNLAFSQTGSITVKIEGISSTKGKVEIGLYNKKENFTIYSKNFKGASITPSNNGITYTFENLPVGNYAIATWQDENENKKIDKNWFGIPNEKYGFSLNKYGTFGPPDFDSVSFKVSDGKSTKLTIQLK